MALKPSLAKITDFETSFDAVPVASVEGEVIWADVRIDYLLSGLPRRWRGLRRKWDRD
jgi:hypothetical protein